MKVTNALALLAIIMSIILLLRGTTRLRRANRDISNALNDHLEAKEPEYINGYRVRRGLTECPCCHAPPNEWCREGCQVIDLMDYR